MKSEEPTIFEALRSKDAEIRRRAAIQAGAFGCLGLEFAGELLSIVARTEDQARATAINSLCDIASDGGLGPFTDKAFSALIGIVRDERESEFMRSEAAVVLGYCVFGGDDRIEKLQQLDDAVGDLLTELEDEWALSTVTETSTRIGEELREEALGQPI